EEGPARVGAIDHAGALELVLKWVRNLTGDRPLAAVGHRVVHGGVRYAGPVRIDDGVLAELDRLVPLAPLHQPHNLAAVRAVAGRMPDLPQVACFDTAFHRTQPEVAQRFGLPRRFTDEGVRRYGFHGLSYEYVASVLPGVDPRAAAGRTVVAHLGNGASLCAMLGCRSVATTMGFTPADGLVMSTRSGSLDPGVLLYLMARHGMDAAALQHLIYHESGLLGVSGLSGDMRTLLESPDPRAAEAAELFVYRVGREIGSLAAALGGLDALVFTGGIGENAPAIRARVCRAAGWLGVGLDEAANEAGGPRISREGSGVAARVLPTDEERTIVAHTRRVLGLEGATP
ncbi:MAG: acetate/propionate family kinase, partial [Gemmataceae bacterium]|nr:acetate/propionate family kinase [Gemmataceae bacterium]